MNENYLPWLYFNLLILVLLAFDLFVLHRKKHIIAMKEALWTSLGWIIIALIFNVYIFYSRGYEDALSFFTGYIVEKALSIDNLFVFIIIFSTFQVPEHLLHKVLFWGIIGAIVMRAFFIFFGIALINNFHWIIYVFGAFLIYTGWKLGFKPNKQIHPESNYFIRTIRKIIPMTQNYVGDAFFVKQNGKILATPLFLVLLAIEFTDVVFAVDSIPAIIGITQDPYLIYTSNIFAILGLRSLYFALAKIVQYFHFIHYGLSIILTFIGFKMLLSGYISIPILVSLSVILGTIAISIILSLLFPLKKN
ncbi:Inner membrane protein alx [Candidatus Rubidus massiliensis]|nr:Inner membrane protein alx [Candidatus Rubidus massiliensis]